MAARTDRKRPCCRPGEEFDYAEPAPLVVEWRQARAAFLSKSASCLERARGGVRMCELDLVVVPFARRTYWGLRPVTRYSSLMVFTKPLIPNGYRLLVLFIVRLVVVTEENP